MHAVRLAALAAALALGGVVAAPPAPAQTPSAAPAKKKITRADELPRRVYALPRLPSELLDAPLAELRPLADAIERDLAGDLAAFDIEDRSTLENMTSARMVAAIIRGDYAQGAQTAAALRKLADKPANQLTNGVVIETVSRTRAAGGDLAAQKARVRDELARAFGAMPWSVVEANVRQAKGQYEVMNPALVRGSFQSSLDTLARNNNLQVPTGAVVAILGARAQIEHVLPFRDDIVGVLAGLIDRNTVARPDVWTSRLVELPTNAKARPVVVGIWDSGLDPAQFRMVPTGGVAFDADMNPAPDLLRPLGELAPRWPQLRTYVKGAFDNQSALDTPEARAFKQRLAQMKAEEVRDFQEAMAASGMYVHGTHVGGIAVAGNPFAQVYAVSMHWSHLAVPPKPSPERSRRTAAAYREAVAGLKAAGARVVNMSWRYGPGAYEGALAFHGIGKDAEERKKLARELFQVERDALEQAIASAPDILFVAGAGNEDNDAGFVEYIPAGLQLPNLITAGAVDQAGDETNFSSFGKTVVVHANGKEVDSLFPGGDRARLSGTSMAAPQVTNLAAKLIALDPSLTPARVKELILKGADRSGRVVLINPKATLALAGYAER